MSSTRHAPAGSPLRQERFASSSALERGLMANLVALRASVLEPAPDRELVWFVQWLSHQPGGLARFTTDLLSSRPERFATPSMQAFGFKPGQVYNANQVKAVREEIPCGAETFLLRGELSLKSNPACPVDFEESAPRRQSEALPISYPAEMFTRLCRAEAEKELPALLEILCLDPKNNIEDGDLSYDNNLGCELQSLCEEINMGSYAPWWCPELIVTLRESQTQHAARVQSAGVITEVGRQVHETLQYALEERCLVLIEGIERIGKTHAAQSWCEARPGRVRYLQTPSSNDEIGFFRAIAEAIGVSINQNSKSQELRNRIEHTIRGADLMLVFDESHYLWPSSTYRQALPARLNWIMTACVNKGVPVALVSTPQFFANQKALKQRTGWRDGQFVGRLGHTQRLPDTLSEDDLAAVAKSLLPDGDDKSIQTLVAYAQASSRYLAGIVTALQRARYLAKKDGRQTPRRLDIARAIDESVIPSDGVLAAALAETPRRQRGLQRARSNIISNPAPAPYTPAATRLQPGLRGTAPAPQSTLQTSAGRGRGLAQNEFSSRPGATRAAGMEPDLGGTESDSDSAPSSPARGSGSLAVC